MNGFREQLLYEAEMWQEYEKVMEEIGRTYYQDLIDDLEREAELECQRERLLMEKEEEEKKAKKAKQAKQAKQAKLNNPAWEGVIARSEARRIAFRAK